APRRSTSPPRAAPPPPPAVDARAIALAARRQAILFRQHVPPTPDRRHLSFFGGAPVAPRGFAWPEAAGPSGASAPVSFLMQVDCAAIPADGRLGVLPDRGVLYVFMDGGANAFRVLYEPGPADDWTEVAPPATLGVLYPSSLPPDSGWAPIDAPRLWPRWTFDPVLVRGGPLPDDPEALAESYAWPGTVDVRAAVEAIPGAVAPYRGFADLLRGEGGRLLRPFDAYPHDWNAVRLGAAHAARRLAREAGTRLRPTRDTTEAESAALAETLRAECREWQARAAAAAPFDAVPPEERDRFWAWIQERAWFTRYVLQEAVTDAVEASLLAGGEAAARVPADAVDRIRHRHALGVATERGVQVNAPHRMLAAPVDAQAMGDVEERARDQLLLLEISNDEGLGHQLGEGVVQLWIRPADLAARRFDRVELSASAY
ncbi:DUF1963 domain-containing protein, partial [Roseisolibacter sp. H3M3-2]|uniref:DUF1963 domain-containing protein n=1 Tax=Roseisolibacter sp. H3M3-2 TaxID=3031323 RepID=UPI0023DCCEB4